MTQERIPVGPCFLLIAIFISTYFRYVSDVKKFGKCIELDIEQCEIDRYDRIILWWTPFTDGVNKCIQCEHSVCLVTEDRSYYPNQKLKVISFYGTLFNESDLPPKSQNHAWSLFNEESPKNKPLLFMKEILELFNFTATYHRNSSLPLTLEFLNDLDEITSKKYYVEVEKKNKIIEKEGISPAVYIQSDCNPPSQRDLYVKELMKYFPIDSIGKCLNNKLINARFENAMLTFYDDKFLSYLAPYKFTLAFENAICYDYITEKLIRPLIIGSLPIYYGSSSAKDWIPNNRSVIFVKDFQSPKQLANYLHFLNNNDEEYDKYFEHKTNQMVTNINLKTFLRRRTINTKDLISSYEQHLCSVKAFPVTLNHFYNSSECLQITNPLTQKLETNGLWPNIYRSSIQNGEDLQKNLNLNNEKHHT